MSPEVAIDTPWWQPLGTVLVLVVLALVTWGFVLLVEWLGRRAGQRRAQRRLLARRAVLRRRSDAEFVAGLSSQSLVSYVAQLPNSMDGWTPTDHAVYDEYEKRWLHRA